MKKAFILSETTGAEPGWTSNLATEFALTYPQGFPSPNAWTQNEAPDLILIQSPEGSVLGLAGTEFCRQLRQSRRYFHLPVLWISGGSRTPDRIQAFNAGVDDCLTLPLDPTELIALLRARLRMKNTREAQSTVRVCGNFKYDPVAGRAWIESREVVLTLKQKELISYFMDHPTAVVTRRELLDAVWPRASVSARTIDAHLTLLRRKLRDFDHQIQSVHSIGYRLQPLGVPAPIL